MSSSTILEYRTTSSVPSGGMRVRRYPSTNDEQVGSLPRGTIIRFSFIEGNWGKLHPSMESQVRGSFQYRPFQIATEGWVVIKLGSEVLLEPLLPLPAPTIPVSEEISSRIYRTTDAVGVLGHRVRQGPNTSSEHVATIRKGSMVRFSNISGDWGKLHPSMEQDTIFIGSWPGYRPNQIAIDGWVLMKTTAMNFFEPIVNTFPAATAPPTFPSAPPLPTTSTQVTPPVAPRTACSAAGSTTTTSSSMKATISESSSNKKTKVSPPSPPGAGPVLPSLLQLQEDIKSSLTLSDLTNIEEGMRICQDLLLERRKTIEAEVAKKEKDNQEQDNLCIICQDQVKNIAIVPCGHVCLCHDCFAVVCSSGKKLCPLCNGKIKQHLKVFM